MDLIWVLLPVAIYLVALLLSAVRAGAFAGGRLARSWAVKIAPRALAVGLVMLFFAPKPPPLEAAALGYVGLILIALGWSLRGRASAGVQAVGFFAFLGSQFWAQGVQDGAGAVLHTGVIGIALAGVSFAVFALAAWYERREQARTGEGA